MSLRLPQQNKVFLVGRLTRDPEVRYTPQGQAVCHFDLAVNRRYKSVDGDWKDEVIFIPIVVWREAAERCGERLKKGSPVSIEGRISQRRWETKEGQKRSALEVVARKVQFLSRPVVEGGEESSPEEKVSSPEAPEEVSSPESEEEEIPF